MNRIRFAARTLSKTPVVTLVVVLSLGLGIGANTAIFSLMYQVVLRSLPVEKPEELVILNSPGQFKSGRNSTDDSGGIDSVFSYRAFRELEKHPQGVSSFAAFRHFGANLAYGNQTQAGSAMLVSGGYFPTLGVQPLIGRVLGPDDDVHGAGQPMAVLGHGYWKDRLGGRTDVLNQPIRINNQIFTIVGVLPPGFSGTTLGSEPDVIVPLCFKPRLTPGWDGTDRYTDYWLYVFARLKPGATRQQAESALNVVYSGIVQDQASTIRNRDADYMRRFRASRLTLKDGSQGQSSTRDESRLPMITLLAATGLVLLIAVANAANLLLARSAQRRKELAIRTSLGASRWAIMAELLTEAVLLSAAGAVAGIILGSWTLNLLLTHVIGDVLPASSVSARLDWPVLLFGIGISIVAGLLFGLYPAWQASRTSPASTLRDLSGTASASTGTARVRKMLVCAQVMLAAVLLIPTGLFLKSLVNLLQVDLGLRAENVITFGVSPQLSGYKVEQARTLFDRIETELAAIPGVRSVTAAMVPLIAGNNWGTNLTVEGYSRDPNAETHAMFNQVGAGFFGKMGIPLISGREFTDGDNLSAPKVAVVNERFAKHFFGDANPIGRKFVQGGGNVTPDTEIIGVIKNAKYSSVKQETPRVYYVPWRQGKESAGLTFYVRTALPSTQVVPQIRRVMAVLDRDLPIENLRTLEEQITRTIRPDRIILQLAAAFAVIATLLAMLGLYGVMAYSVIRRTREIGIRMALGAGADRIRGMVMRELLFILAAGLGIGVPAALGLARFTRSLLFGVKAYDITVVAGAVLALSLAALLAGFLPARRATRVSPTQALRYE